MDPQTPISCTNCKQSTDSTGKTVWICEHCGTENNAVGPSVISTPDSTPDATEAQAAINAVLPGTTAVAPPSAPAETPVASPTPQA